MTVSEQLFRRFCDVNNIECRVVPTAAARTPDFTIVVDGTEVLCEIKQIDPNPDDIAEIRKALAHQNTGRWVPNRLRQVFKNVSGQPRRATVM